VSTFAYYGAEDFSSKFPPITIDVVETKLRLDPRRFFGVQLIPSEFDPNFWTILHMNHVVYHIGYRTRGGMFLPIQRPNAMFFWGVLTLPVIPYYRTNLGPPVSTTVGGEFPICSAMLPSVTDLEEMERVAAIAKAEARANVAALAQVNIVFPVAGAQTPPKGAPTLDPTNT
jgi:hypothetical protein